METGSCITYMKILKPNVDSGLLFMVSCLKFYIIFNLIAYLCTVFFFFLLNVPCSTIKNVTRCTYSAFADQPSYKSEGYLCTDLYLLRSKEIYSQCRTPFILLVTTVNTKLLGGDSYLTTMCNVYPKKNNKNPYPKLYVIVACLRA